MSTANQEQQCAMNAGECDLGQDDSTLFPSVHDLCEVYHIDINDLEYALINNLPVNNKGHQQYMVCLLTEEDIVTHNEFWTPEKIAELTTNKGVLSGIEDYLNRQSLAQEQLEKHKELFERLEE